MGFGSSPGPVVCHQKAGDARVGLPQRVRIVLNVSPTVQVWKYKAARRGQKLIIGMARSTNAPPDALANFDRLLRRREWKALLTAYRTLGNMGGAACHSRIHGSNLNRNLVE